MSSYVSNKKGSFVVNQDWNNEEMQHEFLLSIGFEEMSTEKVGDIPPTDINVPNVNGYNALRQILSESEQLTKFIPNRSKDKNTGKFKQDGLNIVLNRCDFNNVVLRKDTIDFEASAKAFILRLTHINAKAGRFYSITRTSEAGEYKEYFRFATADAQGIHWVVDRKAAIINFGQYNSSEEILDVIHDILSSNEEARPTKFARMTKREDDMGFTEKSCSQKAFEISIKHLNKESKKRPMNPAVNNDAAKKILSQVQTKKEKAQ